MNNTWCPQRCATQISFQEKLVDRAQLPLLRGHCGTSTQASLSLDAPNWWPSTAGFTGPRTPAHWDPSNGQPWHQNSLCGGEDFSSLSLPQSSILPSCIYHKCQNCIALAPSQLFLFNKQGQLPINLPRVRFYLGICFLNRHIVQIL